MIIDEEKKVTDKTSWFKGAELAKRRIKTVVPSNAPDEKCVEKLDDYSGLHIAKTTQPPTRNTSVNNSGQTTTSPLK